MKVLVKLALAGAMALAPLTSAIAQEKVKATVPFAFNVGSKTLPAGEYEIRSVFSDAVAVQNIAARDNALAITMTGVPSESLEKASLTFRRYGQSYFLARISSPGSLALVPQSKLERQVAERARELAQNAGGPDEVSIAALVK
jgi:hypothetical protein